MPPDHYAKIYADACEAAAAIRRAEMAAYHAANPRIPDTFIKDTDAIFYRYHCAIWKAFDESKINRAAWLDKLRDTGEDTE